MNPQSLMEVIANAIAPKEKPILLLEAIWLERSIIKGNGTRSYRITRGDRLFITKSLSNENYITDSIGNRATHIVLSCHGTIDSSIMFIKVRDITTGEEYEISLK